MASKSPELLDLSMQFRSPSLNFQRLSSAFASIIMGRVKRVGVVPRFDKWNYVDMKELAKTKKGEIDDGRGFIEAAEENFTSYYISLIPWVNRLRKVVFPNGGRWREEDQRLYSRMRSILCDVQKDPEVLAE